MDQGRHHASMTFYRELLKLRHRHIFPLLSSGCHVKADYENQGDYGLTAQWEFSGHSKLTLLANLGPAPRSAVAVPTSTIIYSSENMAPEDLKQGTLPEWSVAWFLEP